MVPRPSENGIPAAFSLQTISVGGIRKKIHYHSAAHTRLQRRCAPTECIHDHSAGCIGSAASKIERSLMQVVRWLVNASSCVTDLSATDSD